MLKRILKCLFGRIFWTRKKQAPPLAVKLLSGVVEAGDEDKPVISHR
jgi:hypothetical protein